MDRPTLPRKSWWNWCPAGEGGVAFEVVRTVALKRRDFNIRSERGEYWECLLERGEKRGSIGDGSRVRGGRRELCVGAGRAVICRQGVPTVGMVAGTVRKSPSGYIGG